MTKIEFSKRYSRRRFQSIISKSCGYLMTHRCCRLLHIDQTRNVFIFFGTPLHVLAESDASSLYLAESPDTGDDDDDDDIRTSFEMSSLTRFV